jgi:hypothetical protein
VIGNPGKSIIGTWRLHSIHLEIADSDERIDLLGPAPRGQAIITSDGQMVCILTSTADRAATVERPSASPLFYAGRYRIEDDDKLIVKCDVAWNPAWIGTEQVRFFAIRGDMLSVRSGLVAHPAFPGRQGYGVIDWLREA